MRKNDVVEYRNSLYRILELRGERALVIDCKACTMPVWVPEDRLAGCRISSFEWGMQGEYTQKQKKAMHDRFTMIAAAVGAAGDRSARSRAIREAAEEYGVTQQTVRKYLCRYLACQDIEALAPAEREKRTALTRDEKNMRWALNKFYYTRHKNSLRTAYTQMLGAKYCDTSGVLLADHPTFYQFRYYYRRHKDLRTYCISRDGIKDYQRNSRPLLGDGVQEFAPYVGVGMLDATICDIYLVNDAGNLVGRPILTACIDAYSSLCCGYSLSWEGGTYSLRGLMLNILADKVDHCRKFGIHIDRAQWDADRLPGVFVTDMGTEYKSATFEQIAELGISVINLPAYRPELKGIVEKFFDLLQESYKAHLRGKGVIMPDYQERGAHDYRKDACLTMQDFERIIVRCIVYYNSQRVLENFPYTERMLREGVKPYASNIYEWGKKQDGANLITVSAEQVILTLLPRTEGRFTRTGLKVHRMRYRQEDYTERYLSGGTVTVAYNPEDVTYVWLVEDGTYTRYRLIESRYRGKGLPEVEAIEEGRKGLVREAAEGNLQARIDLAGYIEAVASSAAVRGRVNVGEVRQARREERERNHVDYMRIVEGGTGE